MKVAVIMSLVITAAVLGYGYWDSEGYGGRVMAYSGVSAGLCGARVPDPRSALSVFGNQASLADIEGSVISISGWGTGWREEVFYHYSCEASYRYNLGFIGPDFSLAAVTRLGNGVTIGSGITTVAQFDMESNVLEYRTSPDGTARKYQTLLRDSQGVLRETMAAVAADFGPLNAGIAAGARFGNGDSFTEHLRVNGPDSSYFYSWEQCEPAARFSLNWESGYTDVWTGYVTGDHRYRAELLAGASAEFPFLKGGFLGSELRVFDTDEISFYAFSCLPGVIAGSSMYLGVGGYRPENALKNGIGLSFGLDYCRSNWRVNGAYTYQSGYREGIAVPLTLIEHLYDACHVISVGLDASI